MLMPSDVGFWVVAVIAVAVVVALALWLGRDVVLKFKGFSFSTDRPKQASSDVRVAEQAEIGGSVGRMVGRSLGDGEAAAGATEVGKEVKVGGSVGEMIGVETTRKQPPR
jgi:hypothetical protein